MNSDVAFDRLLTGDVLDDGDDGISLSEPFLESIESIRTELDRDESDVRSYLEEAIENDDLIEASVKINTRDSTPVAGFLALREHLEGMSETSCVQLVPVLDQFLRGLPESAKAPDPFLPVRGDLLHLLVPTLKLGIVYLWRYDCDPCDLVTGDFENYFETVPSDMALYAVYGSDWIEDIREYEVAQAPTILFVLDGRVDARLVGAFPPRALENEIEKLRELA